MSYRDINWSNISRALDFYAGAGFQYVEAPWIVSHEAVAATLPPGKKGMSTELGALVGSAEQSFIELLRRGVFLEGQYMAATPCFRDDEEDGTHQRYFFKVELYVSKPSFHEARAYTGRLVEIAHRCFTLLGANPRETFTEAGSDLELNGLEIGSYGPREYDGHFWTYGTGIAEPRFSHAFGVGSPA